jgi:di/tricarboxylate transporter
MLGYVQDAAAITAAWAAATTNAGLHYASPPSCL